MKSFNYSEAFQRNIGWVTPQEQQILRKSKIAIAGLGGVGGQYLIALARLGVSQFSITDLDTFDLSNFNRQCGATLSTVDQPKIDVLCRQALDINPEIKFEPFSEGLHDKNYVAFLEGADLCLDSLDLYALPLKMKIFDYCYEKKIPIISAAPIGMSTSMICFNDKSPSPSSYFGINKRESLEHQIIDFVIGVSPTMRVLKNLVQEDGLSLSHKKLPSLIVGIELCTSVVTTTALKFLLGRGPILTAPHTIHFDAYNLQYWTNYRPLGIKNPFRKLLSIALKKRLAPLAA